MGVKAVKSQVVRLRLTEAELARLSAFCAERGLTPSEVLRRLAREAGGSGPTFDGETRIAIIELIRQMRAIGININQTARAMNAGLVPSNRQLQEAFGQLTALLVDQEALYSSLCAEMRERANRVTETA